MEQEPKTLILRFRDLVTPPDRTIANHVDIVNKQGYVWWGWWNKAGERAPLEEIVPLAKQAKSKEGLAILLFDSGHLRLYTAHCKEIRWDPTGDRLSSPERTRTPSYYQDQCYLVWFKLDRIDAAPLQQPEDVLRRYSYLRVDSFFSEGPSHYTAFYGKQVRSTDELKQQDRSIWFVRAYAKDDPSHDIVLLDSHTITPTHFPTDFRQSSSFKLLWLSDLHFSKNHHGFALTNTEGERTLAASIASAFQEQTIEDIAGVIVSGDITWRADSNEFQQAAFLYDELAKRLKLQSYDFGLCPGNHDLAFSDNPSEKTKEVTYALEHARQAYDKHYEDRFYLKPNKYMCCGRRFLLGNSAPVEIAFLNSSLLQQQQNFFQGHGYLGEAQLNHVAEQMNWNKDDTKVRKVRPFRIAVLHHHVIPVTYREKPVMGVSYSIVLDAEALARWLIQHRVDLVLHGHMHQPFYSRIERYTSLHQRADKRAFHVVGLGSSGVSADHLGEIQRNTFAILDFSKGNCEIEVYFLHKTNPSELYFSLSIESVKAVN